MDWVQEEFDFFWNNDYAVPLTDFVITDMDRLSRRVVVPLKKWDEVPESEKIASVAVEDPVYREEFGLWEHQKYFVERVFREHQEKGGARLVLADMVGLGKTIQLAMSAKLMALTGKLPILIIVPKTLLFQWQDEMLTLLNMPSAVWLGNHWMDENGREYTELGEDAILKCPRRIGIISQGLIIRKSRNAARLLKISYECVILDEAHRARRKNLDKNADTHKAQPNNLLDFLDKISFQTKSMLLATATPIQINPIEVFDLLDALNHDLNKSYKVLGNEFSVWEHTPQTGLDYISEKTQPPESESEMWQLMRNPFPTKVEGVHSIISLRDQMNRENAVAQDQFVLPVDLYKKMRSSMQQKIRDLYFDDQYILKHNPYIRCIIRRTRESLENTINPQTGLSFLPKITPQLYGDKNNEALELKGYLLEAYEYADEFCRLLSQRVHAGGFMSTLMLRRIGSTMIAGEQTAKKILSWSEEGREVLSQIFEQDDEDDFDDLLNEDEAEEENAGKSEIRNLKEDEIRCLRLLIKVLKENRDTDPKYSAVKDILMNGVDSRGCWKDKGCIVFSQYFDSADYVAEKLSVDLSNTPIGIYAGGTKSGIWKNGIFNKESKEKIKQMVRERSLSILIGTDAASEGLNLQALSTLINLDLPWNPTRLEQRKGRIQRIGQAASTILIYNLRYKDSVEDRVHEKLSTRLQDIYSVFGQIPDVLEDVWVDMAKNDEKKAEESIKKIPKTNPYRNKYDEAVQCVGDWAKCATVLDRGEVRQQFLQGWK